MPNEYGHNDDGAPYIEWCNGEMMSVLNSKSKYVMINGIMKVPGNTDS